MSLKRKFTSRQASSELRDTIRLRKLISCFHLCIYGEGGNGKVSLSCNIDTVSPSVYFKSNKYYDKNERRDLMEEKRSKSLRNIVLEPQHEAK